MKRFRFRLEGLLHVKEIEELRCRQTLANIEAALQACHLRYQTLEEQARTLPMPSLAFPYAGVRLQAHADYLQWIRQCQLEEEKRMVALTQEHGQWKNKLEELLKGKKSLEHYRARLQERYSSLARKLQTKAFDEMASRLGTRTT